ncbi:ATP/GTP-binding protein [Rhizobium sp. Leaf384]|uniref:DUF882 domain-containing protein n=1 Tax=unclassified Rhizobium TaxID=2613769 RepID=UPI0007134A56|nr:MULTISPECIES: DUF882 domain-containing protein [unclassified Rhizobium]KQR76095.1 ATP/GTP-binding protein [Rhizobium sp. Leaf341]KQS76694.1 ATP/GTP-binding protein [Rhizobium sp. Leaf383]KQS77975.1 ATP/GTP-binding protein [Rhizobium sp. Leaf384]
MQDLSGMITPFGAKVRDLCSRWARRMPRLLGSLVIAASMVTPGIVPAVEAAGQTRTLKIYFIHTREKAEITFKRNGRYDPKGLQQVNNMLRDWRRNEPTKMDPRLLDLIWEVYQKSGSRDYIHVVSAYRSPATNGMLRSRTKGVAKKSQHMLGKAMDFYLPDVKLKTLREIGMKFQVGGVGYYPTSGSPFVHMDVGGVRAWPRMSRGELVRLFPDGKTMHLPSDGSPLPGYEQAVADYKRRVGSSAIEVAGGGAKGAGDRDTKRGGKNLFAMLFGSGDEDEDATAIASGADSDDSEAPSQAPARTTKPAAAPVQQPVLAGVEGAEDAPLVAEQTLKAPVPLNRPAFQEADTSVQTALVAPPRNAAQDALAAALPATPPAGEEFADLRSYKVPVPLARQTDPQGSEALLASADPNAMTEDSEALGFVPVPALRPAGEAALMAVAQADVAGAPTSMAAEPLPTQVPAQLPATTAPAVVATAQAPRDNAAAAQTRVALAAPTAGNPGAGNPGALNSGVVPAARPDAVASVPARPTPPAQDATRMAAAPVRPSPPVELASYAPSPSAAPRDPFGNAFDVPAEAPVKAARPKKVQADAAHRSSVRTEPKLTQKIIAEWALSTSRMATLSKPVKAPRFVSSSLRASPTTVYSAGFTTGPSAPDTARFSGTAVNFMEVKRFN